MDLKDENENDILGLISGELCLLDYMLMLGLVQIAIIYKQTLIPFHQKVAQLYLKIGFMMVSTNFFY